MTTFEAKLATREQISRMIRLLAIPTPGESPQDTREAQECITHLKRARDCIQITRATRSTETRP